jgi:hypothetical protein
MTTDGKNCFLIKKFFCLRCFEEILLVFKTNRFMISSSLNSGYFEQQVHTVQDNLLEGKTKLHCSKFQLFFSIRFSI